MYYLLLLLEGLCYVALAMIAYASLQVGWKVGTGVYRHFARWKV